MITVLQKISSDLSKLHDIPKKFFEEIENTNTFGDSLFPSWSKTVFDNTTLRDKFEKIFDKYKAISDPAERAKIIQIFTDTNEIEKLCENDQTIICAEVSELPSSIQQEIKTTFIYLYETAINYEEFETYTNDNLKDAIDTFIRTNRMQICPFCGLEGYLNLEGQSRIALDHWLCKDKFPFLSVNFDNLIPIGDKCNGRPAKGTRNILFDTFKSTGTRIRAFYPYTNHNKIKITFQFNKEPSIDPIQDQDWSLTIVPNNNTEQDIFDSWNSVFNITSRFKDFFRKYIFPLWEEEYKEYIKEADEIQHATDINELKENLKQWRISFSVRITPGALLYRAFIDFLINQASNAYLMSLCQNFQQQSVNIP